MPDTPNIVRANFKIRGSDDSFEVHFNPASLQYTISNQMKNTGSGNSAKQYVDESTGKLSLELVFDTTDSGEDVRLHSVKVAKLMEPQESDKTPPVVEFEWGLYTFAGMMEQYKETIDFFSPDGVPLRASVNLTLASQDEVFEGGSSERTANTTGSLAASTGINSVQTPPPPDSDGRGVTQVATQAGNPTAARAIAAQNGLENMRFTGGAQLQLNASVSAAGVSSLAAVSGAAGSAFGGLHTQAKGAPGGAIKLNSFLRPAGTAQLGTEAVAAFAVGGQARLQGSASFKADVGTAGALKARMEFDGGE
ncbi:MAG: hypothetical protein U5S82_21055 [Gammaproteobacteria bacterium]|nr:hypothetical protein [Gammaproteobacteria bacterium]